jgi:alkanesulfonate monooxygenase SsuD/methylene tetrahydromethanopterin reductase-like flavin-dependent oxidoreductase (luciferase family)
MIGAMAAVTTRLRFVTNVYIVPMRHPLITAKAVGTASVISNGRVVFGAGIGWMVEEFDSAASSFRTRGKRTDEILRILRAAWDTGRVTAQGTHYRFAEVNLRPQPASRIPIWIGGHSEAAVERSVTLGDGWISGRTLADAAPLIEHLRQRRIAVGRAGRSIRHCREPLLVADRSRSRRASTRRRGAPQGRSVGRWTPSTLGDEARGHATICRTPPLKGQSSSMGDRLKNKVAVVTGGGQGIGRGIACAFASEGARIAILEVDAGQGDIRRG